MNVLIAIAGVQAVLYGAIAWLSGAFAYGTSEQDRPILSLLALLGASFLLYLAAIRAAVRCRATRQLAWAIVVPALLFRGLLLPTPPIQEVDIYRYLWDGAVTARGANPYRFAPAQVLSADADLVTSDELRSLVELRENSPAMSEVLGRIHFDYIPTVYPPLSQAVFVAGDWLTPRGASVEARVIILKTVLLTFDIGTGVFVWLLLKAVGMHPGWVVSYAWCPLVLKEFANTGHFDSIAVFLTTAAVWCVVSQLTRSGETMRTKWLLAGAVLLALATGAKLYAIVLTPVLTAAIAARARPAIAAMFASVAAILSAVCLAPMLLTTPAVVDAAPPVPQTVESLPPIGPTDANTASSVLTAPPPTTGLKTFLTRWEMNDFLFMFVVENVRPDDIDSQQPSVWFAVVPNAWRNACIAQLASLIGTDVRTAGFLAARALTLSVFLAIAVALVWKVVQNADASCLLEAAFLTLAWFWLLSPTQNTWYWIWALPLLPFVRGRTWYAVSGLVMLYYLRFWLRYQFPDGPVLGTAYDGAEFFDFIVTWIEYLPWFGCLAAVAIRRRWRRTTFEREV